MCTRTHTHTHAHTHTHTHAHTHTHTHTHTADLLLCVIFAIFEAVLLAGEAKTSQLPSDGIPKDHMSDWFKVFLYSAQVHVYCIARHFAGE